MKKVIIIGGGCAGLSAATALVEKGYQATVFEKSRILGGRTSSVADPATGEPVDNGQHMFLGCYNETDRFLRRLGVDQHVKYRNAFSTLMIGLSGEKAFLQTYRLPAPLHLLLGYMQYRAFSMLERFSIIHVVRGLKKYTDTQLACMSCAEFLSRCKQSQTTQTRFWDLLILATLNVDPKRAPADLLKVVLTQGFMASCKDSASGLADVGLTELFGDAAQAYMAKKGGSIRLRETVSELILDHEKIKGVVLQNGEKVQADYVITAIAPNHLYRLLAKESRLQTLARNVKHMESSPIVSLHIWTNRHLFDDAYVGFWDTPFHWVFRKQSFMQDQSVSHYTLVASGADDLIKKSTSDLITMAKQTLAPLCGDVSISRAKKSLMKNATWLPPLGQNIVRPNIQSQDVKGLYYAGDWVDTGLPCTIESAVKSGHMAASYIINQKFA